MDNIDEIRQDPITGLYVAIAESRAKRPNGDFLPENVPVLPAWDPTCVFCPGNEHMTPPEKRAYRQGTSWWVRRTRNAFEIFPEDDGLDKKVADAESERQSFYNSRRLNGRHDVIIDTPRHNEGLHQRPRDQIREGLWFYRELLAEERADGKLKYVLVFKNRGKLAAASQDHDHTQFTVSPVALPEITREIEGMSRYFAGENHKEIQGQCAYCAITSHELEIRDKYGAESDRHRVVIDFPLFAAISPYASRSPFEIRIVPKMHQADYDLIGDVEATQLAEIVQHVFVKLHKAFPTVSYYFGLHTAPLNSGLRDLYHWHLEVIPVLKRDGALERLGGFPVNTVSPERATYILNSNNHP